MRRIWISTGLSMVLCVPALVAATKTASASAGASTNSGPARHPVLQRWAPQNLNGTISMVDPKMDLVVVRDSSGVPFDFTVSHNTRIDKGATREDLAQLAPKESVSVHYVPEARGDIARTIDVGK